MTLMNEALTYAQLNFKVFPLKFNSKSEQLVSSWKEEATTNPSTIKNWWISNPSANIGLRTGNGLIVIDVDAKKTDKGIQKIKSVIKSFPKTRTVSTPSGGYHLYYKVDRPFNNRVGLYEEIDIRGENGYVLAPNSTVNGRQYQVCDNAEIAEANEAVYDFLIGNPKNETKPMSIVLTNSYVEGCRNDTLFRLAGSLQSRGLDDESIYAAIEVENQKRCHPPLGESEILTLLQSALKYRKQVEEEVHDSTYGGTFTAAQLLSMESTTDSDIVEDMIAIGVTLIGAPQKTGKSFFCIQLCDAITSGKDFLGKKVTKGSALYLAFEDHQTKFQERFKKLEIEPKENFVIDFLHADPYFNLEKRIQKEIVTNPDLRIVIVDTFQKMRRNNDVDYKSEYAEATRFHEMGFRYKLAIILVTHVRKEFRMEQPFDGIYGSRGLPAGSDTILVMYKSDYLSDKKVLAIQGKDIPDASMTLEQNEKCILELADPEDVGELDINLSKVINYLIRKHCYEGNHEDLCSLLNINLTGRGLQALLKKNKAILEESFITYVTNPRSGRSRGITLEYTGNDPEKDVVSQNNK